jgi:hypothetical protein
VSPSMNFRHALPISGPLMRMPPTPEQDSDTDSESERTESVPAGAPPHGGIEYFYRIISKRQPIQQVGPLVRVRRYDIAIHGHPSRDIVLSAAAELGVDGFFRLSGYAVQRSTESHRQPHGDVVTSFSANTISSGIRFLRLAFAAVHEDARH